jgi:hypothetical protein
MTPRRAEGAPDMDHARQIVLSDFIAARMSESPKSLRNLSFVMLVLCGGGTALVASVFMSGAATLDDVGLPLVLFGVFSSLALGVLIWSLTQVRSMPSHPLVVALRDRPRDVVRVIPTTVSGDPALTFELGTGMRQIVLVGDPTRAELLSWLSAEGARVG